MRATVVLPVPGLPEKTRWRETGTVFMPLASRIFCIFTREISSFTSSLIVPRPMSSSSSSMALFSGSFFSPLSGVEPAAACGASVGGTDSSAFSFSVSLSSAFLSSAFLSSAFLSPAFFSACGVSAFPVFMDVSFSSRSAFIFSLSLFFVILVRTSSPKKSL